MQEGFKIDIYINVTIREVAAHLLGYSSKGITYIMNYTDCTFNPAVFKYVQFHIGSIEGLQLLMRLLHDLPITLVNNKGILEIDWITRREGERFISNVHVPFT